MKVRANRANLNADLRRWNSEPLSCVSLLGMEQLRSISMWPYMQLADHDALKIEMALAKHSSAAGHAVQRQVWVLLGAAARQRGEKRTSARVTTFGQEWNTACTRMAKHGSSASASLAVQSIASQSGL